MVAKGPKCLHIKKMFSLFRYSSHQKACLWSCYYIIEEMYMFLYFKMKLDAKNNINMLFSSPLTLDVKLQISALPPHPQVLVMSVTLTFWLALKTYNLFLFIFSRLYFILFLIFISCHWCVQCKYFNNEIIMVDILQKLRNHIHLLTL